MIVKNYMEKKPVAVEETTTIKTVLQLIFNLNISAVLICKGKKLTGIITEEDILQRFFPSISEFMESFTLLSETSAIKDRLNELLDKPAKEIMTSQVRAVTPDTKLMKTLSIMLVNRFSHIPVVNDNNELVGIVSQGDIFKALVSGEIPYEDNEGFRDWMSYHFDKVFMGNIRYKNEVRDISSYFKTRGVKTVLDIGMGTGGHDIFLAEKGYIVEGVDDSRKMYKRARKRYEKLSASAKMRLRFEHVQNYISFLKKTYEEHKRFDAVIIMGDLLSQIAKDYERVLRLSLSILENKGSIILQVVNYEKILKVNKGFGKFTIASSELTKNRHYAFIEFYDRINDKKNRITLTMGIFMHDSHRWRMKSINSLGAAYYTKDDLISLLKQIGYKSITAYGARYNQPLFDHTLKPLEDDWIIITAHK